MRKNCNYKSRHARWTDSPSWSSDVPSFPWHFSVMSLPLIQRCYPDHSNPLSLSTSRDNPAAVVECEPSSSSSSDPRVHKRVSRLRRGGVFSGTIVVSCLAKNNTAASGVRSGGGKSPSLFSNHRRGDHCFLPFLILLLSHNFTSFSQSQLSSNGQMNSLASDALPPSLLILRVRSSQPRDERGEGGGKGGRGAGGDGLHSGRVLLPLFCRLNCSPRR